MKLPKIKIDFIVAILLYIIMYLSISYNVSLIREISTLIFLTFIPGYLLVKTFNLSDDFVVVSLYSIGLSLSILMFVGFIVNSIFINAVIFNMSLLPLTLYPLLTAISIFFFGEILIYLLRARSINYNINSIQLNFLDTVKLFILIILPIMSYFGGISHNNNINIIMILGIFVVGLSCISEKIFSQKFYSIVIISISLALVFHIVTISPHLLGSSDVFDEFFVFRITDNNNIWINQNMFLDYSLSESLNSMLSITILPTIYTTFSLLDQEVFFKYFYPIIFAFVPLIIYKIYESQTDKKIALFGVFFYITTSTSFYALEPLSLSRQMIGFLFLSLCVYILLNNTIDLFKRRLLLVIFSVALIISHYSLAFIYIGIIILYYALSYINLYYKRNTTTPVINISIILIILISTFSWFIYINNSPINQLLNQFTLIVQNFSLDFFNIKSRGFEGSLASIGLNTSSTIIGTLHKYLLYLEHFFIAIGLLVILLKPKKYSLSSEFRLITILIAGALALFLIIPNMAATLNLTRVYAIIMPFLGLFIILGGITVFTYIKDQFSKYPLRNDSISSHKTMASIFAFLILTTFLFQIGLVNHMTNDYPYSYSLDLNRKLTSSDNSISYVTHSLYFMDGEITSTKWLIDHSYPDYKIYADWNSRITLLFGYGLVPENRFLSIQNTTQFNSKSYIYMKALNTKLNLITLYNSNFDSSVLSVEVDKSNKIYSNSDSYLFFNP
jgi:uncharacterized membrane protein